MGAVGKLYGRNTLNGLFFAQIWFRGRKIFDGSYEFNFANEQFFNILRGISFAGRSTINIQLGLYFADTKHKKTWKVLIHVISQALVYWLTIFACHFALFYNLEKKIYVKNYAHHCITVYFLLSIFIFQIFSVLFCPRSGHNPSISAKTVRDNFKDYFMNEGAVDWQWKYC